MKKHKDLHINKWIGYILLALYLPSAIGFIWYCTTLGMLPVKYIIIAAIILAIFGVLFAIMHEKLATSVIASILTIVLTAGCMLGASYVIRTSRMITDVSTADVQQDIVSVYVMDKDSAETIEDIAAYQVGIISTTDRKNTDKTLENLETTLGNDLKIAEFDNMFKMMDALKEQTVQAVILNDAYVGIVADVEDINGSPLIFVRLPRWRMRWRQKQIRQCRRMYRRRSSCI